jgi:asparagine synthase (glutamine-hydrolysing)
MCGVVGLFSQGGKVESESLERAVRVLNHRGPDATRQWIDERSRTGLGHARLSIIDLTTGDQPLANEDGTVRAIVNGEFYDFERIRKDLEKRGHRFRTASDSEILLHLYEEYGASCLEHLRGEFSLVLFDAKNDLLFAARDRFGIKPLFYGVHNNVLMLASEAKSLFAAGFPARWDEESYFQASATGGPLQDRSFFAGVRQVPPGHYLLATRSSSQLVRYWDFDYPEQSEQERLGKSPAPSDAELADDVAELAHILDEAVRLRLRADVPVACYLSGGIDSCTVLGLASKHAPKPIHSFTLGFDRAEYDEAPIAREMAAKAGSPFTEVPVDQRDFARDFADAIWHAEVLLINSNGVAKYRLSRAVRDAGYKVVLTGEGSDEIFAGYPHFRRDLFLQQQQQNDDGTTATKLRELERTNAVSRGSMMPDGEGLPLESVRGALGFVPTWLEAGSTAGRKLSALLAPDFTARFAGRDAAALFINSLEVSRQLRNRPPVHQAMYLWSKSLLPNFILSVLGDRMEMAHSIEGRLPFLDHHVVERARSLPVNRKIRGTVEKFILREVARPVVTETVYRRQKHPFYAPPVASSPGGPLYELMQDMLRGPVMQSLPFFDRRRVVGMLDQLPKLDDAALTAIDTPLMLLLSTCLLQQRFGLNGAA